MKLIMRFICSVSGGVPASESLSALSRPSTFMGQPPVFDSFRPAINMGGGSTENTWVVSPSQNQLSPAPVGRLQLRDVELLHLEEGFLHARRLLAVLVSEQLAQELRHDLPGDTLLVLTPAALFSR